MTLIFLPGMIAVSLLERWLGCLCQAKARGFDGELIKIDCDCKR